MVFKVKSINTVDNAGKQVDGMKRPREPPTGGNRMDIGRIYALQSPISMMWQTESRHLNSERMTEDIKKATSLK